MNKLFPYLGNTAAVFKQRQDFINKSGGLTMVKPRYKSHFV